MGYRRGNTTVATEDTAPADETSGKWSFPKEMGPCYFVNGDATDYAYVRLNTATAATKAMGGYDRIVGPLSSVDLSQEQTVAIKSLTARWYTSAGGAPGAAPDGWSVTGIPIVHA